MKKRLLPPPPPQLQKKKKKNDQAKTNESKSNLNFLEGEEGWEVIHEREGEREIIHDS